MDRPAVIPSYVVWKEDRERKLAPWIQFQLLFPTTSRGGTRSPRPNSTVVPEHYSECCHFLYNENTASSDMWRATFATESIDFFAWYFRWFHVRFLENHRMTVLPKFTMFKSAAVQVILCFASLYFHGRFKHDLESDLVRGLMYQEEKIHNLPFGEALLLTHALVLHALDAVISKHAPHQIQEPTLSELFAIRVSKRFPSFYALHVRPLFADIVNERRTLVPFVVTPSK